MHPMDVDPTEQMFDVCMLRRRSQVLASFPWLTDVVVHGRMFATYFEDDQQDEEDIYLMPLARRMDRVFKRLETTGEQELLELSYLIAPDPSKVLAAPSRNTFVRAVALLTALRLLDIGAKVKGEREDYEVLKHAKVRLQKVPNRIWETQLGDWPRILRECRDAMIAFGNVAAPETAAYRGNNMVSLIRQAMDLRGADVGVVIMRNFFLAAASVALIVGNPRLRRDTLPEIPERPSAFYDAIIDNCIYEDVDAMKVEMEPLTPEEKSKEKNHSMRTVLSLAALATPLYVLTSVQLTTTTCAKKDLLLISKSLGNSKPPELQDIEMELWKAIFLVAAGKKAPYHALKEFLDHIDWQALDNSNNASWFHSASKDVKMTSFTQLETSSPMPSDWTLAVLNDGGNQGNEEDFDAQGENDGQLTPAPVATGGPSEPVSTPLPSPLSGERAGSQAPPPVAGAPAPSSDAPDTSLAALTGPGGQPVVAPVAGAPATGMKLRDKARIPIPPNSTSPEKRKRNGNKGKGSKKGTWEASKASSRGASNPSAGRSETTKPDTKPRRDRDLPASLARAQSLHAKYIEIDLDDIEAPRTATNLTPDKRQRFSHTTQDHFTAYTASGEAVEVRPRLHTQDDVKVVYDFMAAAIDKSYHEGRPSFLTKPEASKLTVMPYAEYSAQRSDGLLKLITDKILIVTGCPTSIDAFDEDGLSELKDLNATISVQDKSEPVIGGDYRSQNKLGSLQQVLNESRDPDGKVLNALDLPMGIRGAYPEPLSSETRAWLSTEGLPYCKGDVLPADHLRWALAATAGAFHPWHIDNHGASSYIGVQIGAKLVYFGIPRERKDDAIDFFLGKFDVSKPCEDEWDVEAILLLPGDTTVFGPGILHAVLTVEHSICFGGHCYPSTTNARMLVAYIHAFMLNSLITNTETELRRDLLLRTIVFFHHSLVEGKAVQGPRARAHVPVVSDMPSVVNLLSICALSILANALSPETYRIPILVDEGDAASSGTEDDHARYRHWDLNALPALERKKCIYARGLAWEIVTWLKNNYVFVKSEPDGAEEEVDTYDEVVVPFFGHLCRGILQYHQKARDDRVTTAQSIPHDDLSIQLHACFLHNPEISAWMAVNEKEDVHTLIYPFEAALRVQGKRDSAMGSTDLNTECNGETERDVKYKEGRKNNWAFEGHLSDGLSDEDISTESDSEYEGDKSRKRKRSE